MPLLRHAGQRPTPARVHRDGVGRVIEVSPLGAVEIEPSISGGRSPDRRLAETPCRGLSDRPALANLAARYDPTSRWLSQRGGDRLHLCVVVEHFLPHLTTPTRLFVATKRQ